MKSYSAIIDWPLGKVGIVTANQQVQSIAFLQPFMESVAAKDKFTKNVVSQLEVYFEDPAFQFDLPLNIKGRPFQKDVWNTLCKIPVGETKSYSALAKALNTGARAVGNACRKNPIAIIIPCHRVVAKTGIGGFGGRTAGEQIKIKQWLLAHERDI